MTGPSPGAPARTVVIGIGNPVLGDDGVGLEVARRAGELLRERPEVTVREAYATGFELLDLLAGFERAILVDAIATVDGRPGAIFRLRPEQLPPSHRLATSHEANLATALELGRAVGLTMPAEVILYAIEVADVHSFTDRLSRAVAAAVEPASTLVAYEARRGLGLTPGDQVATSTTHVQSTDGTASGSCELNP